MFTIERFPDCFCCFLFFWICEPIPLPYQLEDVGACSLSAFCDNLLLLFIIFLTFKILAVWSSHKSLWRGKNCRCLNYPAQKHCSPSLEKSLEHIFTGRKQWQQMEQQQGDRQALTGFGSTRKLSSSEVHSLTYFLNLKDVPEPSPNRAGDAEGSGVCPS